MSCKKCGGVRSSSNVTYPAFAVDSNPTDTQVQIGAKASLLLDGLENEQVFLRVGKTLKVSNTAAADLLKQGAPIWIL